MQQHQQQLRTLLSLQGKVKPQLLPSAAPGVTRTDVAPAFMAADHPPCVQEEAAAAAVAAATAVAPAAAAAAANSMPPPSRRLTSTAPNPAQATAPHTVQHLLHLPNSTSSDPQLTTMHHTMMTNNASAPAPAAVSGPTMTRRTPSDNVGLSLPGSHTVTGPPAAQPHLDNRPVPLNSMLSSSAAAASVVQHSNSNNKQGQGSGRRHSKAARRLDALFGPQAGAAAPGLGSMQGGASGAALAAGLAGSSTTLADQLLAGIPASEALQQQTVGTGRLGLADQAPHPHPAVRSTPAANTAAAAAAASPAAAVSGGGGAAGGPVQRQKVVQLLGPFTSDSDAAALLDQFLASATQHPTAHHTAAPTTTAPAAISTVLQPAQTHPAAAAAPPATGKKPAGSSTMRAGTEPTALQQRQQLQAVLSRWEASGGSSSFDDKISIYDVPEALWLLEPSDRAEAAAAIAAAAEAEAAAHAAAVGAVKLAGSGSAMGPAGATRSDGFEAGSAGAQGARLRPGMHHPIAPGLSSLSTGGNLQAGSFTASAKQHQPAGNIPALQHAVHVAASAGNTDPRSISQGPTHTTANFRTSLPPPSARLAGAAPAAAAAPAAPTAAAGAEHVDGGGWVATTPTKKTVRRHSSKINTDALLRTPPSNLNKLQTAAVLGFNAALMQEGIGLDLHLLQNSSPTENESAAASGAAAAGRQTGAGSNSPNCLVGTPRPMGVQNLLLGWSPFPGLLQLHQSPAAADGVFMSPAGLSSAQQQDGTAAGSDSHRPTQGSAQGMLSPGALINNPLSTAYSLGAQPLSQDSDRCWGLLGHIGLTPPASPDCAAIVRAPAGAAVTGAGQPLSAGAAAAAASEVQVAAEPGSADKATGATVGPDEALTTAPATDAAGGKAGEQAAAVGAERAKAAESQHRLAASGTESAAIAAPSPTAQASAALPGAGPKSVRSSSSPSCTEVPAVSKQQAPSEARPAPGAADMRMASAEAHAAARTAVMAALAPARSAVAVSEALAADGCLKAPNATAADEQPGSAPTAGSSHSQELALQQPLHGATPNSSAADITAAVFADEVGGVAARAQASAAVAASTDAGHPTGISSAERMQSAGTGCAERMQPPAVLPSAAEVRHTLAAGTEAATEALSAAKGAVLAGTDRADASLAGAAPDSVPDDAPQDVALARTVGFGAGADAEPTTEAANAAATAGTTALRKQLSKVCSSPVSATPADGAAAVPAAYVLPAAPSSSASKPGVKRTREVFGSSSGSTPQRTLRSTRRRSVPAFDAGPSGLHAAANTQQGEYAQGEHMQGEDEGPGSKASQQQAQDNNTGQMITHDPSGAAGDGSPAVGAAARSDAAGAGPESAQVATSSVATVATRSAAATASVAARAVLSPCMGTPAVTARPLLPAPDTAEAAGSLQDKRSRPTTARRSRAGQQASAQHNTPADEATGATSSPAAAAADPTSGPTDARRAELNDLEFPALFFDPEDPHTLRTRPRRAAAKDADRRMKEQKWQPLVAAPGKGRKTSQPSAAAAAARVTADAGVPSSVLRLVKGKQQRQQQQGSKHTSSSMAPVADAAPKKRALKRAAAAAAAGGSGITRPPVRKRACPRKNAPQATAGEEEHKAAAAALAASDSDNDSLEPEESSDTASGSDSEAGSDWAGSAEEATSDDDDMDLDAEYCPHSLDLLAATATNAAAAAAGGSKSRARGPAAGWAGSAPRQQAAAAAGAAAVTNSGEAGPEGAGGEAAAAAAVRGLTVSGQPRKSGPKGGRPKGAGNKTQMAPKGTNFGCRSARFTGVYKAQRVTVRWRTQFSYCRKVLNVGCYATEEDAARAWNAAAMHFRGGDCWVNPVEPVLPEDEGLAIAASLPQPDGGSLLPALRALQAAD